MSDQPTPTSVQGRNSPADPSTVSSGATVRRPPTVSDPQDTVPRHGESPVPRPPVPDGYELLDEIGRGGMGVVYRARDVALGRDVAVKVLDGRYAADSAVARRFVEEARITARLQHPGIPPVHHVGTLADGSPFLAMKLIRGRTLDVLIRDRPAAPAEPGRLVAIFEAICQAVGFAHAEGVIHRDLKPANVMVGAFGEVQVMDWGLAKVCRVGTGAEGPGPTPGPDETAAGSVLGTPAYMPPEQAAGAVNRVDARSDVFGLGGILCALLTGRPPFSGGDIESTRLLAARGDVKDAFGRLDGCGAEPGLIGLCKRCLAPEQLGRPADGGTVAAAVAGLRAEGEARARRAEGDWLAAQARAGEEEKRRWVLLAAAGIVAVVLAAGSGTTTGAVLAVLAALGAGAGVAAWQAAAASAARREADQATAEATRLRYHAQLRERATADGGRVE